MFSATKFKKDQEHTDVCRKKRKEDGPAAKINLFDNFKQGDLIFGLMGPRKEADRILEREGFTHTCANELNSPAVQLVMDGIPKREAKKHLDEAQYKHYKFLSKHADYLKRKPGKTIPYLRDKLELGAAYGRACKLLLTNDDPERTYKAHVLTKDIDWSRVCDKKKSELGVTDREMRAAYRQGRNPHVLFYDKNLNLLDVPPWEKEGIKEEFEHYESERKGHGAGISKALTP